MTIRTQMGLAAFQQELAKKKMDMWLVFLADDHGSEYIDDHFKEVEFLSGFTGTNAVMLITPAEARLWTDGRYFAQADRELFGSGIILMRMGEDKVPTVEEYLRDHLSEGMRLGFDGRRICAKRAKKYRKLAMEAKASVMTDKNLLDRFWTTRPPRSCEPLWVLEDALSGESAQDKVERVRKVLRKKGVQGYLLTSLTDIAWLLNLRGADVDFTPVFLAFVYMTEKSITLYVQKKALTRSVKQYLKELGVKVKPYDRIYRDVKKLREERVMLDPGVVNETLRESLPGRIHVVEKGNPTTAFKAKKNKTELKNTRRAHLADGIAVTKFLCHIKTAPQDAPLTELLAADILHDFRAARKGFLEESFETISAYGPHGALPHYAATPATDARIERRGLYLVDSGGHYLSGTTDITRTIAMGELTEEEKRGYTLVLKGALRLMAVRFPKGTTGSQIDALARVPLWEAGMDFRHGTGHGVGHILSVHEGPNSFRSAGGSCALRPGMITTDEPGLYVEGRFGVRIENELLCVKDEETDFGKFYSFYNLTLAPIDLDPLVVEMLDEQEKRTLNAYHKRVYETLKDHLTKEEAQWLLQATREV